MRKRGLRGVLLAMLVVAPRLASASSALIEFARCITRAGATFYTAAWCPHCARQSNMFGNAIGYVHVVDCTVGCPGIASFPTWTFKDGSSFAGVASFDELGRRTRCRLGDTRDAQPDDAGWKITSEGARTRERNVAGVKIIEVLPR